MGGSYTAPTPPAAETTASMLAAYQQALPGFMQANQQNILPYEQSVLKANQQILPAYNDLQSQIYAKYGPQYQDIANKLQASQAAALTQSQADILKNQGVDYAAAAKQAAQAYDPEYFASREAASKSMNDLLGSYDVSNGLSGGEQANVERGLNRQGLSMGTLNAPNSNTNTIRNAFGYDDRLQQKKSGLAQALQGTAGTLGALKSGFDPGAIVGNALYANNAGQGQQINANNPNVGQGSNAMGSNLLGATTNMANSQNLFNSNIYGSQAGATAKTYESTADQFGKYMSFI